MITAAGASSGIDMALFLAAAEYGDDIAQEIQLIIEYDPEPPFNTDSPAKAPKHVVESLQEKFAYIASPASRGYPGPVGSVPGVSRTGNRKRVTTGCEKMTCVILPSLFKGSGQFKMS